MTAKYSVAIYAKDYDRRFRVYGVANDFGDNYVERSIPKEMPRIEMNTLPSVGDWIEIDTPVAGLVICEVKARLFEPWSGNLDNDNTLTEAVTLAVHNIESGSLRFFDFDEAKP